MARKKNKARGPQKPTADTKATPARPPAAAPSPPTPPARPPAPDRAARGAAGGGKGSRPPDGFDDVDDFFFGSETGAFTRDEFDYDPFEDHTALSGRFEAATEEPDPAANKTRVVMDVPAELEAQLAKARGADSDDDSETRKHARVDEAAIAAREEAANTDTVPPPGGAKELKPASAKAKAKADDKAKAKAEADDKAAAKAEADAKAKADDEAKAKAEADAKAAAKAEADAKAEAEAEQAAAAAKAEADAAAEAEAAAAAADVPEDPAGLPDEPAPEEAVPLSARRAAGAAAAAEMDFDSQVFVGDEEDEGAAIGAPSEEATIPIGERKVADRTAPVGAPLAAVAAPLVGDLPGADDWSGAVSELTAEAEALTTKKRAGERAAILFEVGRILAHRVGDWSGAEARFEAALQSAPEFGPALHELTRLHAGREEWSRAVDLLARRAETASDPASQTAALLASAHIQLSQLDRLAEAAADLKRALVVAPDNYIALRFLREIHYRTQSWSALVEVLHQARELAGSGERLRVDYELGRLHDEVLKTASEAVESFRGCLAIDGRFIPALLATERLLQDTGDTAGLVELYRTAAGAWGGPDAAFWLARAARTGDAGSLASDAVDADFRGAIAASSSPDVLAEEYRHWLASQARWDGLSAACAVAVDGAQDSSLRAHLFSTQGRIALQQKGDAAAARVFFDQALEADPTCVDAREGRRQVLVAEGDWPGLTEHLEGLAEAETDTRVKVAIYLKLAEVAEDRLDDAGAARMRLEAACQLAPSFLPATDALIGVLGRESDHDARAERLEQAASLVDGAEARSCYLLRASRAWDAAGRRDRSISALQRAAEAGPGSLLAREWLVESFAQDGRWAEVAESLRQAAAETEDVALKVSLLYRSGRIALTRLEDQDAAEAAYRSLLDVAPDFLAASLDLVELYAARGDWDAYGLLLQQMAEGASGRQALWTHLGAGEAYERARRVQDALGQYNAALAVEPGSPVAASALRRVYRSTGNHGALAEAYGQQLRGTTDASAAGALRVQLIAALRELGDAGGVMTEVAELAKSEQPSELPRASVGVVCEALQLWDQAMEVYTAVGDDESAGIEARASCLFQSGLLNEEVREDGAAAAGLYERALALQPEHAMALEGLERVHSQAGDSAALADVYDREARSASAQPVRTFYALLAGEQLENLGDQGRAIAAYEIAFEDPVGRQRAFDALRRLAIEAKDSERLRAMVDSLVGDRSDVDAISRLMELGEGLGAAGDEDGAIAAFGEVLARSPGFLPAASHLERLHVDREDWNGVLSALEVVADGARAKSVRTGAEARTQRLLSDKGVTSDSAFEFYRKLNEREPDNLVALRGLGGIHLSRGEFDEAEGHLTRLAELAAEPAERAEAASQLGRIALDAHGDTEAAVSRFEEALEHQGSHRPALDALRKLHTEAENWTSLVGVVAREANAAPEEGRVPFFAEIARIWQDRIGNSKVAVSSWQKVLQSEPGHAEAAERLLALYEASGDWSGYLDVAERGLESLSGEALRDRRAELGLIAHERAGQTDRAVSLLRAAAAADPSSASALSTLRAIATARGDWEQVISLTEQEVELSEDPADKVRLLEDAARIKLDQLLDREGASLLFRQALDLDANCNGALGFFVNYYFDTEQWEEAPAVFAAYEPMIGEMDIEDDDDDRIEATAYYYKFGTVLGRAKKEEEALARFARALELTPTHLPSLEAAAPRYFEAGDWARTRETSRAILRLRGGTGDAASLTQLYLRLGRAELELDDSKNALKRFKKALDQSPNHVAALQGIAAIHQKAGDWNSLLSTYNSIIKYARDPDQVILAYMTKGDVLEQKLHFTDKAVLHYEKVLMYDKQNFAALSRLGEIAVRTGDSARAGELAGRAAKVASGEEEVELARILDVLATGGDAIAAKGLAGSGKAPGDRVKAFRAAVKGKGDLSRVDAADAFRGAFCTL